MSQTTPAEPNRIRLLHATPGQKTRLVLYFPNGRERVLAEFPDPVAEDRVVRFVHDALFEYGNREAESLRKWLGVDA